MNHWSERRNLEQVLQLSGKGHPILTNIPVLRVILCGGAEFTPACETLDRAWLRLANIRKPRVLMITAAADDATVAFRHANPYMSQLGAMLIPVQFGPQLNKLDSPSLQDALIETPYVYMTDGNPELFMSGLQTHKVLPTLYEAAQTGTNLVACGASAMALCDYYWDGGSWVPGLGFLHGIAVLPHHERIAARFSPNRLRENLPDDVLILGLEDGTGVYLAGSNGRVLGSATVTIYHRDKTQVYPTVATFVLPRPALT